jgi:hypothetical protein
VLSPRPPAKRALQGSSRDRGLRVSGFRSAD